MSLADYFAQELSRLRVTAQAFAQHNPGGAGHLLERGNDPDVERLLEGVAFLIAGFRARVDQTTNVLAQHLAEISAPHILRSLPAATIVEFSARIKALTRRHRIEPGKSLESASIKGTRCTFQTTSHVDLWPIELIDASLERLGGARSRISIDLSLGKHGILALEEEAPLRFYIHHHSDPTLAPTLLLWLSKHLTRVSMTSPFGDEQVLPPHAVQLLDPTSFAVFPWPSTSPRGYRSAVEFFALPEKFFFFELHGLDKVRISDTRISLHLDFDETPRLTAELDKRTFRLHCVPAINLFSTNAEPIRRDPVSHEYILRAEDIDPRHMEVYDVVSVASHSRRHHERAYSPLTSGGQGLEREQCIYSLRRERSETNEGIDTYLSLVDVDTHADTDAPERTTESLSIELICTNRKLANQLRTGDVHGSSQQALFRSYENITRVSSSATPALDTDVLWSLASYLGLGTLPPREPDSLRRLLRSFDFVGAEKADRGRLSRRQIDAITSLHVRPGTWVLQGAPVRMLIVLLEVDDLAIGGSGAAHLLGMFLNALYGSFAPINTAMQLRMRLTSTATEYSWPVHIGS